MLILTRTRLIFFKFRTAVGTGNMSGSLLEVGEPRMLTLPLSGKCGCKYNVICNINIYYNVCVCVYECAPGGGRAPHAHAAAVRCGLFFKFCACVHVATCRQIHVCVCVCVCVCDCVCMTALLEVGEPRMLTLPLSGAGCFSNSVYKTVSCVRRLLTVT